MAPFFVAVMVRTVPKSNNNLDHVLGVSDVKVTRGPNDSDLEHVINKFCFGKVIGGWVVEPLIFQCRNIDIMRLTVVGVEILSVLHPG